MKKIILFATLVLLVMQSKAQTYWQQEVNTNIRVVLDDKQHFLNGYEEFVYVNHSPDTLHYIYIHLWPNAYKNDRTAFSDQKVSDHDTRFYFSKENNRGYIDSLEFSIDGMPAEFTSNLNTPDIARIDLQKPLLPHEQIKVTTPFRVKIPRVFSRLGHTGQAYFISQWFPKPAVYDRFGWHPIPFLDQGEFYSEIGTYDVSITLPENYIVMATGNCTDDKELGWLDSLSTAPLPPDTLYTHSFPKSSEQIKILHFHEEKVHDFAWFADKKWIVRKDTTSVNGNTVSCYAAFLPVHKRQWLKGTDYLKATVKHYSDYVGDYPYKTIKAVEGDMIAGGGMEYPTVTIIDRGAVNSLEDVIVHEAGHNWFYGILATNERDHAWMDEGINTFYEHKIVMAIHKENKVNNKKDTIERRGFTVVLKSDNRPEDLLYYQGVAAHTDQPLEQTSAEFTLVNYGGDVYFKTGLMMEWLEQYMGEESFKEGMHDYFNTWKFKHPYPADLKQILQRHTDKSLDWFFTGVLNTRKKIDFKISGVSTENGSTNILVKNKSAFAAPVRIDAYNKDSIVASAWSAPFTGTTKLVLQNNEWTKLKVANEIPDANLHNNIYKKSGLCRRAGLGLRTIFGLGHTERTNIWALPAIGYNHYDGFQLGLLFHNLTLPESKFQFVIAPLYSLGSKSFNGSGTVGYDFYPNKIFHNILLQADVKSYHFDKATQNVTSPLYAHYLKIAPALHFIFKESDLRSPVKKELTLKGFVISEDDFNYTLDVSDSLYKPNPATEQHYYGLIRYQHQNNRTFNPFSYSAAVQLGKSFAKINLEANIRIDYHMKNKGFYIRGFAGKFIIIQNTPAVNDHYALNTTYTGLNDYLYEDTYLGRTEQSGFFSQQISLHEGGFKIPTNLYSVPIGRTDDWLATLNFETDIPLKKFPLRLFLDIGTFADAAKNNPSGSKILYDGGISFHMPYDILNIYVPLIASADFSDYQKSMFGGKRFLHSIVFSLQLDKINWLRAPKKAIELTVQ